MPISSLFLRSAPMAKLAVLSLLSSAVVAQSGYQLVAQFSGDAFFDNFDFITGDPNGDFVDYVDYQTAYDNGLVAYDGSSQYLMIDSTTVLNPNGVGRESVKLVSKQSWTHALVITDLNNMPGGVCGVSGRHYLAGPDPNIASGEIDIITGINTAAYNQMTLFSQPTCSITGDSQTGTLLSADCASSTGCSILDDSDPDSFGAQFNDNGGGVFATLWDSNAIQVWFFTSGTTPDDITNGTPDPTNWGTPVANFQGSCNIDESFADNKIVFDMDFCSSLVEANWASDGCDSLAATCREYVASFPGDLMDFSDFDEVYWGINAVTVYQQASVASSSSSVSVAAATSLSIAAASSSAPSAASSTVLPAAVSSTILPAAVSSTTSPAPSSTGLGAYTYYGCVQELDYIRILNDIHFYDPAMTLEMCEVDCAGYTYFGAEYGTECYCGNSFAGPVAIMPDTDCFMTCGGDGNEQCGGPMRLSVYTNAPVQAAVSSSVSPSSSTSDLSAASSTVAVAAVSSAAATSVVAAQSSGAASSMVLDSAPSSTQSLDIAAASSGIAAQTSSGSAASSTFNISAASSTLPIVAVSSAAATSGVAAQSSGSASSTTFDSAPSSTLDIAATSSGAATSGFAAQSSGSASSSTFTFPALSSFTAASSSVVPNITAPSSTLGAAQSSGALSTNGSFDIQATGASSSFPSSTQRVLSSSTGLSDVLSSILSLSSNSSILPSPSSTPSKVLALTTASSSGFLTSSVFYPNSTFSSTPTGYSSLPTSTEAPAYTLSTVYATSTYTITSCAATVTDCPARIGKLTTETISLYTTYCPVADKPSPTPSVAPQLTTSTVYATSVYTITSCAATVTDCPARIGQLTTETISLYTTVCPVADHPTPTPAPAKVVSTKEQEFYTTIVTTTYTTVCPEGLTTITTSSTLTLPVPTTAMTTRTKTATMGGSTVTLQLTMPACTTCKTVLSTVYVAPVPVTTSVSKFYSAGNSTSTAGGVTASGITVSGSVLGAKAIVTSVPYSGAERAGLSFGAGFAAFMWLFVLL
ncbi:uncharacterized protein PAC_14329 [Phialocephala subalpina]|uniref:WSC domain-containing protein n=1 Tax=Phialocephala subalpina TaxID=576137 RepID=A0A1L7XHC3_9HELO|nr:uncharacterized protein PAC_14329 [Phialocephala subalpina]